MYIIFGAAIGLLFIIFIVFYVANLHIRWFMNPGGVSIRVEYRLFKFCLYRKQWAYSWEDLLRLFIRFIGQSEQLQARWDIVQILQWMSGIRFRSVNVWIGVGIRDVVYKSISIGVFHAVHGCLQHVLNEHNSKIKYIPLDIGFQLHFECIIRPQIGHTIRGIILLRSEAKGVQERRMSTNANGTSNSRINENRYGKH